MIVLPTAPVYYVLRVFFHCNNLSMNLVNKIKLQILCSPGDVPGGIHDGVLEGIFLIVDNVT